MLDSYNRHNHEIDARQTNNIELKPNINIIKPMENAELIPILFYSDMAKFVTKFFRIIKKIGTLRSDDIRDNKHKEYITEITEYFWNYNGIIYDYELYLKLSNLLKNLTILNMVEESERGYRSFYEINQQSLESLGSEDIYEKIILEKYHLLGEK